MRSPRVGVPAGSPAGPASDSLHGLPAIEGSGFRWSLPHVESPDTSRRRQGTLLPLPKFLTCRKQEK